LADVRISEPLEAVHAFIHAAADKDAGMVISGSASLHPSNAHRIWRLMNALIKVHPDWADPAVFEDARAKMIGLGLQAGFSLEDLFAINDAETVLSLWKAVVAMENDLWE
jgi:hypothetical protein